MCGGIKGGIAGIGSEIIGGIVGSEVGTWVGYTTINSWYIGSIVSEVECSVINCCILCINRYCGVCRVDWSYVGCSICWVCSVRWRCINCGRGVHWRVASCYV